MFGAIFDRAHVADAEKLAHRDELGDLAARIREWIASPHPYLICFTTPADVPGANWTRTGAAKDWTEAVNAVHAAYREQADADPDAKRTYEWHFHLDADRRTLLMRALEVHGAVHEPPTP